MRYWRFSGHIPEFLERQNADAQMNPANQNHVGLLRMNASRSPGEPGSPRFEILQVFRAAFFAVTVFMIISGLAVFLGAADEPRVFEQRQTAIQGVGMMSIGAGLAVAMAFTFWREWMRSRTGEYPGIPTWVKVLLVALLIGALGGLWLVDSTYPAA
jgi:hypothetical protein